MKSDDVGYEMDCMALGLSTLSAVRVLHSSLSDISLTDTNKQVHKIKSKDQPKKETKKERNKQTNKQTNTRLNCQRQATRQTNR